jgi:hypothetical protein
MRVLSSGGIYDCVKKFHSVNVVLVCECFLDVNVCMFVSREMILF